MKRMCVYVDPSQSVWNPDLNTRGYIPSAVHEGVAGHSPLLGNGPHAAPWYWGKTLAEAESIAKEYNRKLGLTERDVQDIVDSSMLASLRHGR